MYNLNSIGHKHLRGYRELTDHKDPIGFDPVAVHIPAVDNNGAALLDSLPVGSKVKRGTALGIRPDFSIPLLSSVSGEIKEIKKEYNSILGRLSDFFVIENDKKYDSVSRIPLENTISKQEFVDVIKKIGVVGMGGAGFPTYIKYSSRDKLRFLLVNDVECEPYLTTDYLTTKRRLESIIVGMESIVKILGLEKGYIAIKKNKQELIEILTKTLINHPLLELKLVPDVYPAGFERHLIKLIFKKEYGRLPSEIGIVVNNVETVAEIGDLFLTGESTYLRTYTFAGDGLKENCNVIVPFGTSVGEIVEHLGGYAVEDVAIVIGGPMMGKAVRSDDIPLFKYNSSVMVYDYHKLQATNRQVACWHCGKCVDVCPMDLQPVLIRMALNRQDYEAAAKLDIGSCVSCSLCSTACPSHIDLCQEIAKGKLITKLKVAPAPIKK